MSDEFQTALEFFDEKPQTYFCQHCGEFHEAGKCPKQGEDHGERAD